MCNRDAEKQWAQMLISSEVDVGTRHSHILWKQGRESTQSLRNPGSSSSTEAPMAVSVWGRQGRQGSGPGWCHGCFPLGQPQGITLPEALHPHPDTSSSCLVTLAVCSCLGALVSVCKMERIVSCVGIIWPLPMFQILTVFCTWALWKDVVLKDKLSSGGTLGVAHWWARCQVKRWFQYVFIKSLRDKAINIEIIDKNMLSKSK